MNYGKDAEERRKAEENIKQVTYLFLRNASGANRIDAPSVFIVADLEKQLERDRVSHS